MKQFFFAAALAVCAPIAHAAEQLSLPVLSDHLNGIKTAAARFVQTNDDGSQATGILYVSRPGKMRFEYDAPHSGIVMATNGAVLIIDPKSNQAPETYPLRRTPLSVLLARKVNLSAANMVVGHSFDGTATRVRAQDPKNPEYGSIEFMFTSDPVALREWVIYDDVGGQTRIQLGPLQTGMKLDRDLFTAPSRFEDR
ncbi:Outer membrane lipoprotein-sorting protein [Epibacterium ulvae]|uniref:Outer membrane lipoprotein-sorting protein n=1 Tax=Epibacterium ulvae TaxID=1156985 RepID=A0A1G5QZ09_9RHOB|nr:outer membrane lipoprotein carrier protein LolA [Epibacterium ulvae]SCZ66471.1 Outer membrane lipoprotein-sorting protein [Epibacterium ulvae]